ncbi:polysaccharide pyruvyl transferase [Bradyrhizobium sp. SSBR45G]|uniref:polysaccharide pyruvyl transferase family protein n=1 Tax=unclassified Bradyrhizobium TaxID=2631580 RepID=UPI002342A384|nr:MULTISPECIES: polysaccharide pyruvyl transferase family protein [unclassified Bradyrhizobium]GLH76740.1 polysaccharide pyruvyl transferase [Bradyrhizobium sp. SSBR45G]GLH83498.1 polysaccharide pyruvyl transferase [Bradyrhizobium sp. SSBR45R]
MNIFLLGATPSISVEPGEDPMSKLAKTGGNTGNQVIAYGLLSQIAYDDISWDYRIDPKEVRERFDMIVIAAANFLFPKFDFGGMADYIERADLPVAIVGLGAQSNSYDPNIELMPGTERFVKVIAERAPSIGVRGPYTQQVLARRGVHNVTVTGCPSFYMRGPGGLNLRAKPFDQIKRISINASRDVIGHSFDKEKMKKHLLDIYRTGVEWKADFIAQSEQAEIKLADRLPGATADAQLSEIVTFLSGAVAAEAARNWAAEHVKVFFDVDRWLDAMSNYDFVFGTRFHGCMAAIQRGVPAIVICHDTRTEDMCSFLGMPNVSIVKLDKVDVQSLYNLAEPTKLNQRYDELYRAYIEFAKKNGLKLKG